MTTPPLSCRARPQFCFVSRLFDTPRRALLRWSRRRGGRVWMRRSACHQRCNNTHPDACGLYGGHTTHVSTGQRRAFFLDASSQAAAARANERRRPCRLLHCTPHSCPVQRKSTASSTHPNVSFSKLNHHCQSSSRYSRDSPWALGSPQSLLSSSTNSRVTSEAFRGERTGAALESFTEWGVPKGTPETDQERLPRSAAGVSKNGSRRAPAGPSSIAASKRACEERASALLCG